MSSLVPWDSLEQQFSRIVESALRNWISPDKPYFEQMRRFAVGRLDEGRRLVDFFLARGMRGRVLDLGAGNGGVTVGLANRADFDVVSLDIIPNSALVELRGALPIPLAPVVGSGHDLPFADGSFDIVLCLDTIEHVPNAAAMGREIVRVLRPGGMCMVTTPPKLRYWFQRDPHFGIPGLLFFGDRVQRWIGRWRVGDQYDVVHIFRHVDEVAALFPGSQVEVLWNRGYDAATATWRDRIWFRSRFRLWDRILLVKR